MQNKTYLFGDSTAEAGRLRAQALLLEEVTSQFLARAGIAPGMRVLDVGCGAGDVTICLAERVGPSGTVLGIDMSPTILETARWRIEQAKLHNVRFIEGDIASAPLDGEFDAIVGRCVLFFVPDRVAALRRLRRVLRPGGVMAFQEPGNATVPPLAVPASPLLTQVWDWIRAVYERSGADLFMGLRLFNLFRQAGLPAPVMHLEALAGGGPDWGGYEHMASLVRILLPRMIEFGIATEAEVAVDSLPSRLCDEMAAHDSAAVTMSLVSAWTRVGTQ